LPSLRADPHHTLVEDPDSTFNNRQEHLLETLIPINRSLYLDQINNIVTKKPNLIVLVKQ
jgi:hypothetical protein